MASYERPESNEWVQPVTEGYKMACCDCGLVHDMDFRIYEGKVQLRARRNNRSTAAMRREDAKRHNNPIILEETEKNGD